MPEARVRGVRQGYKSKWEPASIALRWSKRTRTHVRCRDAWHDPAYYPDFYPAWLSANLALQRWVGILSERWVGLLLIIVIILLVVGGI